MSLVPCGGSPVKTALGPVQAVQRLRSNLAVVKVYQNVSDAGRARLEADALMQLGMAEVNVPSVLGLSDSVLVREYVPGPVIRHVHWDPDFSRAFARWLFCAHVGRPVGLGGRESDQHLCWLVGDTNLGNFVVDLAAAGDGTDRMELCGIDFGDTRIGDRMEDVGEAVMRIVGHRPGYTMDRWACAVAFAREYGRLAGNEEEVCRRAGPAASDAMRKMAVWRRDVSYIDLADAFGQLWSASLNCFPGA